ncbi:MAG: TetR/AcrR family transcriptional regulator [Pseudomonadota bacterium]
MATREALRPGGRSARVQESVHKAVHALVAEQGREALAVPLIAARAGVTPSTIYRRWGDMPGLLADVALERMRPDTGPADTGSLRSDLEAWTEQYLEEMSSVPGRTMLRDVLVAADGQRSACQCAGITLDQLQTLLDRAAARGEAAPPANLLLDRIVAPIAYRILFGDAATPLPDSRALVAAALLPAAQ